MGTDFETERLLLRPLQLADAEQTQPLFAQWEIVRYLSSVPWPFPPDGAFRYYRDVALPAVERGEQWHWTLRLKQNPEQIVGAISLVRGEKINRGFWIGLPWQRRGLMTEAVAVTSDFWFDVLGFNLLRVPKAAADVPSRRISESTGMRLIATEEQDFVAGRLPAEVWELTAAERRARKASQGGGGWR